MDYTGKHVVCVDGSPAAKVALHFACKKTAKRGGVVEMLHVIPPSEMQNMFGALEVAREEQQREAEMLLAELRQSAFDYSGVEPHIKLCYGKPGEEILNAILEDQSIDMLMLGVAPDSTPEGRKLINWLSAALGDKLLVPILLVPGNLTDMQIEALS